MPIYRLQLNQSTLKNISIYATSYDAGSVVIVLDPQLNLGPQIRIGDSSHPIILDKCYDGTYKCTDIKHTDAIIKFLIHANWLHQDDQGLLALLLKQVQKHMDEREKLGYGMTKSQDGILLAVAEVYIDDIIENVSSHSDAMILVRAAFYADLSKIQRELANLLREKNADPTILASVEALWKICHGQANLENTFTRLNTTLPLLISQRNTLMRDCTQKMLKKHATLDEAEKVLFIMGMELYRLENFKLSPMTDTGRLLPVLFADHPKSLRTKILLEDKDLTVLLSKAFSFLDFYKDNTYLEKAKFYQQRFSSPVIAEYVNSLEKARVETEKEKDNLLLLALKKNDKLQVEQCLTQNADINQFFLNSYTPLIYAVQHCHEDIVKLLIDSKANVDQGNKNGVCYPLHQAIQLGKPKIAEMLLNANAKLFRLNNKKASVPLYMQTPNKIYVQLVTLFELALDEYNKDPSEERKQVLAILLRFGGGLGLAADVVSDVFQKAVMVGATGFVHPDICIVRSLRDFISTVSVNDYSHWHHVCLNALQSSIYNNRPEVVLELVDIYNYLKSMILKNQHPSTDFPSMSASQSLIPMLKVAEKTDTILKMKERLLSELAYFNAELGSYISTDILKNLKTKIKIFLYDFQDFKKLSEEHNFNYADMQAAFDKFRKRFIELQRNLTINGGKQNLEINCLPKGIYHNIFCYFETADKKNMHMLSTGFKALTEAVDSSLNPKIKTLKVADKTDTILKMKEGLLGELACFNAELGSYISTDILKNLKAKLKIFLHDFQDFKKLSEERNFNYAEMQAAVDNVRKRFIELQRNLTINGGKQNLDINCLSKGIYRNIFCYFETADKKNMRILNTGFKALTEDLVSSVNPKIKH